MPEPVRILEVLLVSLVAAAAFVLLLGWPWRAPHRARARMGGVLGVGAGIYAGCWLLGVSPNWPPREDQDRLLFILLPAAIAVETAASVLAQPRLSWFLRLLVAVVSAPILLFGSSYLTDLSGPGTREWTSFQAGLILAALATALAVVWSALWLLTKRSACRSVPVVLSLICAGAGVTVMLSGYASGGQIGLTIAAAVVGAVVASLALGGPPEMNGVVGVGVVGLFALLVMGRFFGQLSTANAALLFCAPLFAWGAELPVVRRGGSIAHGLARLILPAAPAVIALLLAQMQFVTDAAQTAAGSNEPSADAYMNFGK